MTLKFHPLFERPETEEWYDNPTSQSFKGVEILHDVQWVMDEHEKGGVNKRYLPLNVHSVLVLVQHKVSACEI
jgi:hypothetical protein